MATITKIASRIHSQALLLDPPTEGKLTLRVDLDLNDGRHIAFEAKRHGQNKPSVEVLELLPDRCTRA